MDIRLLRTDLPCDLFEMCVHRLRAVVVTKLCRKDKPRFLLLYLALEDTYERLQKRLAQMTEQDSEHLIFSVFSETLDEGLIERLTDFWSEHTDTVLIVIDTLQRVRSRTPDNGSYAADYDTLARLKEFSDTYGVTVLVVHHTRKEGAEDVFNTISGTNGLMGAADGALILYKDKRTASDAVLEAVGRDQPQL